MSRNYKNRNRKFNNYQKNQQPSFNNVEYRHQNQLSESDVGITEYLTDTEGFSAVIKSRYSDFHVNEIDLDGNVAKLTDTTIPHFQMNQVSYKETEKSPSEFVNQEVWENLKMLAEGERTEPVCVVAENLDKDTRYAVHTTVKDYFGKVLVANTKEIDGKKFIEINKYDKDKEDSRSGFEWPKDKGEYVHFLLYKEAMDTIEAISKLSEAIKISAGNFDYAGVKDRRAKTTQWVSVRKVQPWKIKKKTKGLKFKVGNFTFKDKKLKLGQLNGNKFKVALRNVLADDDLVNNCMEKVSKTGFINYFGLQRFGNDKEAPTYEIGKNLLLGNWKEAVDLILKPKNSDDPTKCLAKAKNVYKNTGDAKKALNAMRFKNKQIEVRLLEGLAQSHKNDYVNALEKIPRNMRLLYIHAVQSLIWNKMVSKRLKLFGMVPVVGDFVVIDDKEEEMEKNGEEQEKEESTDEKIDDDDGGDANEKPLAEESQVITKQKIKILTEEDIPNYTIYDIVLPLPGFDVNYPEYMKEFYKEELEALGLTLEMTRQKMKTYSVSGNYRNMLCKINDMTWKIITYNNPTDTLILSDWEELLAFARPENVENGEYKGLILEFSLPSACYATMLLREILKTNTSSSAQAKLNSYHDDKQRQKQELLDMINAKDEAENTEDKESANSSSLLADPVKYAEFKNSIFNIIGEKRKHEEEEKGDNSNSDVKKLKDE